jgi:cyclic pyranopterin phosphate synthase
MQGARDLVDPFGRVIRDLRVSVTDRCNFRCTYCMPEEGMQWLPRSEVLTFEEIERLAGLMVRRYGVESIRLTGGEPTVRARLPLLVEKLAALGIDVAMTTNGATLRLLAPELKAAGLRRVNISLDTLDRDRFVAMTRRDELAHVLDGIDAALEAGFDPVKLNTVVQRGVNDDEVAAIAARFRGTAHVPRVIE